MRSRKDSLLRVTKQTVESRCSRTHERWSSPATTDARADSLVVEGRIEYEFGEATGWGSTCPWCERATKPLKRFVTGRGLSAG